MLGLSRKQRLLLGAATLLATASISGAQATVEISSKATANMNCSGGVCSPTAANAVLNAGDLETMLASGNVSVTTTGAGVQADDIVVAAPISWSASGTLSFDAWRSIAVEAAVSVNGLSGMSLITNDGGSNGTLWFSQTGNIAFANLSSQLFINRSTFTLAGDIKTLAADIGANAFGNYALATSYDAKNDGTYTASPLPDFGGVFTGLGNSISNISIDDQTTSDFVGLFRQVYSNGIVQNVGLADPAIAGPAGTSSAYSEIGGLAGLADGLLFNDTVTGGEVTSGNNQYGAVGGLAGGVSSYQQWVASAIDCSSSAYITSGSNSSVGGLVGTIYSPGQSAAIVAQSWATGAVSTGSNVSAGDLVGSNGVGTNDNTESIVDSYATGNVAVSSSSSGGGLVGYNDSAISASYSTGAPTGRASGLGGLIGYDAAKSGSLKDTYWDTTTSGITNLAQGAGNIANDPGIRGLSTKQLTAKLPKGFGKTIWKESKKLNGDLPYLIANPPAK